jgi:hypothetical protein
MLDREVEAKAWIDAEAFRWSLRRLPRWALVAHLADGDAARRQVLAGAASTAPVPLGLRRRPPSEPA